MSITIGIIHKQNPWRNTLVEILTRDGEFSVAFTIDSYQVQWPDRSSPDIILIDLSPLVGRHYLFLNKLLLRFPDSKIVMISASPNVLLLREVLKYHICGYLLTTSSLEFIKDSLLKAMDGGRPLSPSIANFLLNNQKPQTLADCFPAISKREEELIGYILNNTSTKEAAYLMNISSTTINFHLRNIYQKLRIRSKYELLILAGNQGINTPMSQVNG